MVGLDGQHPRIQALTGEIGEIRWYLGDQWLLMVNQWGLLMSSYCNVPLFGLS